MGAVGSALTVSTAAWPHRAAMAAPAWRAGGEVMLPWAEAVRAQAARRRQVVVVRKDFIFVVWGFFFFFPFFLVVK